MNCRLENLSSYRRTAWVEVATPPMPGEQEHLFVTDRNLQLRAVRGGKRGRHTQFWRIGPVPFAGRQIVQGTIRGPIQGTPPPFAYSPWVVDEPMKLLPSFAVRLLGQDWGQASSTPTLVEESPAHQRWHLRTRMAGAAAGFVAEFWVTFYHDQDVADLKGRLVWSDRTVPDLDLALEALVLKCGEPIALDFAVRNQHFGPSKDADGNWVWLVAGNQGFIDGSGICVSGRLLGTPIGPLTPDVPQERLDSLRAALEAPVKGVCTGWPYEQFLSLSLPWPLESETWDSVAQRAAARFRGLLGSPARADRGVPPAPFNAQRPLGNLPATGSTGDQEDFACTAGGEATLGFSPAWLWEVEYSLSGNLLRGFCHYENDTSEVAFADHPGWLTWSGWTHFPASDKLGKRAAAWGDLNSTGWTGWDDQHRSWNNWMAYLAMADDPLQWQMLLQHLEVDKAMHKNRPGAPRALGRLFLAWCHAYTLMEAPGREAIREMLRDKVEILASVWRGGKHNNPVRIMAPQLDPRLGVNDPVTGEPLPNWSVWMESLLCIGLRAVEKTLAGDPLADTCGHIWRLIAATIVDYGFYIQNGQFWVCDNVWYPQEGTPQEGLPIAPGHYSHESPYVNAPGIIHAWVIPTVLAYYTDGLVGNTQDRAELILAQWGATDGTARDPRQARWWAISAPIRGLEEF